MEAKTAPLWYAARETNPSDVPPKPGHMLDRPLPRRDDLINGSAAIRRANSALFHARRQIWRVHPRFTARRDFPLARPAFLLGTQGGGLTLLSRILHRHPDAVSATGGHRYWAGDDESQNVYRRLLPPDLGWIDAGNLFPSADHNWLYATDALLPRYARDASHATPELAAAYRAFIRSVVSLHGGAQPERKRFIDKSQSLTVRVGLVKALLGELEPRFVLLTRNPFASVWRTATRDAVVSRLDRSLGEKVELAAQHWTNSMRAALAHEDGASLKVFRFEDLLASPEIVCAAICRHVGLEWRPRILPSADDVIPWGSAHDAFNRRKWHPLRADVNEPYLADIPDWARARVEALAGDLAERFGYR